MGRYQLGAAGVLGRTLARMKHESANLDLLRTIAVALVVIDHLRRPALSWITGFAGHATDCLGLLGVAIFFVHTTLVLMQSLERTGPAPLAFYVRRAFRIYPLAMVSAIVGASFIWMGNGPNWSALASNLLLVQNLTGHPSAPGPLWTLPYEVQMYLVLPALFLLTLRSDGLRWVLLLWAAAITVVVGLWAAEANYWPLRFIPCFLPGVVAYILAKRVRARLSPWVLIAVVACGAVLLPTISANVTVVRQTPFLWLFCLAVGFTIPHCRELTNSLVARCSKVVAKYSYGIYLTHTIVIAVAFRGFGREPLWLQIAVCAVFMVALPYVAYKWIEAPGIALGKRLANQMKAKKSDALEPGGAAPLTSPVESK